MARNPDAVRFGSDPSFKQMRRLRVAGLSRGLLSESHPWLETCKHKVRKIEAFAHF